MRRKILIFIVGPTAVGKTRLAVRLAKRLRGEIISCDSMQVYKGMAILSQSPSAKERRAARHHLVSIIDPVKEYSVAHFRKAARGAIGSIVRRGKVPIVAGGTGLYAKALIDGLFPSPEADMVFRRKMERSFKRFGAKRLYAKLARIDPQAAELIHPNDARRVIRALEIYHSTGRTMTELKSGTKGLKDHYDIRIFGLTRPREEIYAAIDARVDLMLKAGLLREVKRLRMKRLSMTAEAALGLKDMASYLDGECDLEGAKALMKMNTRRYAKRQLTWFRADKRVEWFDVSKLSQAEIVARILGSLKREL
jgi:tRNA dimethylallyltransferase